MEQNKKKFNYLKKGEGKLASYFYGKTDFSEKRKQQIIKEQEEREEEHEEHEEQEQEEEEEEQEKKT